MMDQILVMINEFDKVSNSGKVQFICNYFHVTTYDEAAVAQRVEQVD